MDELTAALLAVSDDPAALDALTDLADAGDVEGVSSGEQARAASESADKMLSVMSETLAAIKESGSRPVEVTIHQSAPVVTVHTPPVTVNAPPVSVTLPESAPVVTPTPVVNVTVTPDVTVNAVMPPRTTTTTITRDVMGRIDRVEQSESDKPDDQPPEEPASEQG